VSLGPIRRRLLFALLDGRLPGPIARAVHARIGRDETWRAAYDGLRRAEMAATGQNPTARQADLVEQLVLTASEPPPRARLAVGAAFAAATAAALLVVLLPSPSADELAPRGSVSERVGVRVRCLADGARPQLLAETLLAADAVGRPLACPAGSLLAFSLTNLSEAERHVFVVGVRADGTPLWYAPFGRAGASAAVAPGTADRVLDVVAETRGMDTGEGVTLFALFSESPLSGSALESQLRDAEQRGLALGGLERLPIEAQQGRATLRDATPAGAR
jgi:hypothetical protein